MKMKSFILKPILTTALLVGVAVMSIGCAASATNETTPAATQAASGSQTTASAQEKKETVTVWAGGSDNVRMQYEAQISKFNETNDKYVAELQFIPSGTGAQGLSDKLIAAYKAGQKETDFDVIELGGEEIMRYIEQGGEDLFINLDLANIPNAANVQFEAPYYTEKFLPYRGTTVVLAYDSEKIPTPPVTTEELYTWIRNNPGRFGYNTPSSGGAGGSFVATSIYNFLPKEALTSTDEKWTAEWDKGFTLLEELHPFMYQSSGKVVYPNKNQGALDLLSNGEIDMTPMWADMAISQQRQGTVPARVKVTQIDPAFTGNVVVLGVPEISGQKEGAQAFINHMISADGQNIALDNMAAIPVIDFSLLDPELTKIIENLKIKEFRVSNIGDLGKSINERWDRDIATLASR